ncbi:MAG: hypothetical protein AB1633_10470, partial [Elusimicrobiota bacterium]
EMSVPSQIPKDIPQEDIQTAMVPADEEFPSTESIHALDMSEEPEEAISAVEDVIKSSEQAEQNVITKEELQIPSDLLETNEKPAPPEKQEILIPDLSLQDGIDVSDIDLEERLEEIFTSVENTEEEIDLPNAVDAAGIPEDSGNDEEEIMAVIDESDMDKNSIKDNTRQEHEYFYVPGEAEGKDGLVIQDGKNKEMAFVQEEKDTEKSGETESGGFHGIATVTLAEVYIKQGLYKQALAVYEKILLRDGPNESLSAKIENLKKLISESKNVKVKQEKDIKKRISPTERRRSDKPLAGVKVKKKREEKN